MSEEATFAAENAEVKKMKEKKPKKLKRFIPLIAIGVVAVIVLTVVLVIVGNSNKLKKQGAAYADGEWDIFNQTCQTENIGGGYHITTIGDKLTIDSDGWKEGAAKIKYTAIDNKASEPEEKTVTCSISTFGEVSKTDLYQSTVKI